MHGIHCKRIADGGQTQRGACSKNSALTLEEAIIKGLSESAGEATVRLLEQNIDALAIINEKLIPALDVVGKGFEEKKMFLPQLLMSADAAKASLRQSRRRCQSREKQ